MDKLSAMKRLSCINKLVILRGLFRWFFSIMLLKIFHIEYVTSYDILSYFSFIFQKKLDNIPTIYILKENFSVNSSKKHLRILTCVSDFHIFVLLDRWNDMRNYWSPCHVENLTRYNLFLCVKKKISGFLSTKDDVIFE